MDIEWSIRMANVYAPEFYTPRWHLPGRTPERDRYLRENHFVDPAILAADLGLHTRFIVLYMRKLGLRSFERIRN